MLKHLILLIHKFFSILVTLLQCYFQAGMGHWTGNYTSTQKLSFIGLITLEVWKLVLKFDTFSYN